MVTVYNRTQKPAFAGFFDLHGKLLGILFDNVLIEYHKQTDKEVRENPIFRITRFAQRLQRLDESRARNL
ncbi:hypothetical protein IFVP177_C1320141 [Vibrio parahaemolyticus]